MKNKLEGTQQCIKTTDNALKEIEGKEEDFINPKEIRDR